jgi:hypothetical protein
VLLYRVDVCPRIHVGDSLFAIDLAMVLHARSTAIAIMAERGCAPLDAFMALTPVLSAAFFSLVMLGHPFGRVTYAT